MKSVKFFKGPLWNVSALACKRREETRKFGGVLILLYGDFKQTLPVISRSKRADELKSYPNKSLLWSYLQKLNRNIKIKDELVQNIFQNIAMNYENHQCLCTRAILTAKSINHQL